MGNLAPRWYRLCRIGLLSPGRFRCGYHRTFPSAGSRTLASVQAVPAGLFRMGGGGFATWSLYLAAGERYLRIHGRMVERERWLSAVSAHFCRRPALVSQRAFEICLYGI